MTNSEIEWLFVSRPAKDKEILEVEHILGIKFPDDYKECLKQNAGGSPEPNVFDFTKRKEAVFNRLFTCDPNDAYYYIPDNYKAIKDRLIDDIYPIADDVFGNCICFDYREGKDKAPKVVFWDHEVAYESPEKAIYYICDSFIELLSKLYFCD
ncbi:SMI1/KNR4 family protein [Methanolobus psychrotolerans]|uniref:SMI1/KNR4 family protein n=1 Tax=Methanolobus psychrotolerans TaxID=1874706 RepID=UPI000B9179F1|nr:SMI1/KNR4 family protein [Methanolobus psychrotolerans]